MLIRMWRGALDGLEDFPDEQLAELIFRDDWNKAEPRPSVYDGITASELEQIHAEHAANAGLAPPATFRHVDLSWQVACPFVAQRTNGYFKFQSDHHAEMHFADSDALVKFVAEQRHALCCVEKLDKSRVYQYVRQKVAASDAEWLAFLDAAARAPDWRAKLKLS